MAVSNTEELYVEWIEEQGYTEAQALVRLIPENLNLLDMLEYGALEIQFRGQPITITVTEELRNEVASIVSRERLRDAIAHNYAYSTRGAVEEVVLIKDKESIIQENFFTTCYKVLALDVLDLLKKYTPVVFTYEARFIRKQEKEKKIKLDGYSWAASKVLKGQDVESICVDIIKLPYNSIYDSGCYQALNDQEQIEKRHAKELSDLQSQYEKVQKQLELEIEKNSGQSINKSKGKRKIKIRRGGVSGTIENKQKDQTS